MTDSDEALDAAAVRERLPGGWRVENDGDAVYGYAEGHVSGPFPDPAEIPASFGIRPDEEGQLWRAVWLEPNDARGGRHGLADHATGLKERCVAWVAEKAGRCGHDGE